MGTIKELNAMCVSKGAEAGAYHLTMPSIIFPIQLFVLLQVSTLTNYHVLLRIVAGINLGLKDIMKFL